MTPKAHHDHDPLDYTDLDPEVEDVDRLIVEVVVDVDDAAAGQDGQVASHLSVSVWTISFLLLHLLLMLLLLFPVNFLPASLSTNLPFFRSLSLFIYLVNFLSRNKKHLYNLPLYSLPNIEKRSLPLVSSLSMSWYSFFLYLSAPSPSVFEAEAPL